MEVRKCGRAAMAVALALACAAPPGLAHADQLVRTYAQGEAVPSELELNGEEYALESWEPGGGLDAATRSFERTAYKTVAAGDYLGQPEGHFDARLGIAEDGFSGSIPLVGAKAEVSQSHPERSDYEETVEFSFITKEELDGLPAARTANVAGSELRLDKLDVKADRVPSDPGTEIYSGSAVYGIHEQRDVPDEYRLTATYAGELSREASPGTVVAVYETVAPASAAPAADGNDEPAAQPDDVADAQPPAWLIVAAALVIVVCAAVAFPMVTAVRKERGRDGPVADEEDSDAPEAGKAGPDARAGRGEDAVSED